MYFIRLLSKSQLAWSAAILTFCEVVRKLDNLTFCKVFTSELPYKMWGTSRFVRCKKRSWSGYIYIHLAHRRYNKVSSFYGMLYSITKSYQLYSVPKLSKIVGYSLPSLMSKILKIDILVMIASVCTQLFTEELIWGGEWMQESNNLCSYELSLFSSCWDGKELY